jgi:hypothetical protein
MLGEARIFGGLPVNPGWKKKRGVYGLACSPYRRLKISGSNGSRGSSNAASMAPAVVMFFGVAAVELGGIVEGAVEPFVAIVAFVALVAIIGFVALVAFVAAVAAVAAVALDGPNAGSDCRGRASRPAMVAGKGDERDWAASCVQFRSTASCAASLGGNGATFVPPCGRAAWVSNSLFAGASRSTCRIVACKFRSV